MSDYRREIHHVQNRCKELESYMKQVGNGKAMLPPECGKEERETAKIIYDANSPDDMLINVKTQSPVAKTQWEYFESPEDNFGCPRPHTICGEQISDDPADL